MNTIENLEGKIKTLKHNLEKAKAEFEFSEFLSAFKEFIPDPKLSKELNDLMQQDPEYHTRRSIRFFLKKRKFFISETSIDFRGTFKKTRTIEIPIKKQTSELLNDLKNVLEKHKDILGPITNGFPD